MKLLTQMSASVVAMRILIAALLLGTLFFSPNASAQENVYVVKKGEVWDWYDVIRKGPNWGTAGLGYDKLLSRLNGSPKLKPGTRIRMAPIEEMLKDTGIFQRWTGANAQIALKRRVGTSFIELHKLL
ncbi:MAG: hypothetical protein JKY56_14745 [Kofleriaceae bacterium]|nr:hypothetical protein [Kofleriaceae bacterium]